MHHPANRHAHVIKKNLKVKTSYQQPSWRHSVIKQPWHSPTAWLRKPNLVRCHTKSYALNWSSRSERKAFLGWRRCYSQTNWTKSNLRFLRGARSPFCFPAGLEDIFFGQWTPTFFFLGCRPVHNYCGRATVGQGSGGQQTWMHSVDFYVRHLY